MKLTSSNAVIVGLLILLIAGLSVEGFKSYTQKFNLEERITVLEQVNLELREKQNYLFELMAGATIPTNGESAIRVERTNRTVSHEDLDVFCLAKNVYHEAGVEDELGMFAVAQVTINRVRNANYPDSICEVVMQPSQFSWTHNKDRRWSHPSGVKWETAKRIARQVIKEGYRIPALQSAMFYHADYAKPDWRDPRAVVAQIGTHIFYSSAL